MTISELKQHYSKDEVSGCWHWTGLVHRPSGVAVAWCEGRKVYVARLLYEKVTHSTIPHGTALHRLCDSEDCVAPAHHKPIPKHSPIAPFMRTKQPTTATTMAHKPR